MAHEVRLGRVDRRQAILNSFPALRVRVRVPSRPARAERIDTARANAADEVDDLRAARGILFALLLSVGLWASIGFLYWFIAR